MNRTQLSFLPAIWLLFLTIPGCCRHPETAQNDRRRSLTAPAQEVNPKSQALLTLDRMERWLASEDPGWRLGPLLTYLKAHPEDKDLGARTSALARRYSKVSEQIRSDWHDREESHQHRLAVCRVRVAWTILYELEILRNGMKLTDGEALLGEPRRSANKVFWRCPPAKPRGAKRVGALLQATSDDAGVLSGWKLTYPFGVGE